MTREEIIRNLEYTMEKHKNDTVNTFETNISVMCKDILDYLEQEPCEDCISRQEAINCVTFNEFRYKMVEDMKTLPSVAPKGKIAAWVPIDEEPHEVYECNACGWLLYDEDRIDFKYCPNCGAKMVESEESEEV